MALTPIDVSSVDYVSARKRATRIFVDREGPKQLFKEALSRFEQSPNDLHFLSFHGVGGQGKTALFNEFCRILTEKKGRQKNIAFAPIDLHFNRPDDEVHCWVVLRNAISAGNGAKFPCFDFAYADFMQQTRPDAHPAVLGASRLVSLRGSQGDEISGTGSDVVAEVAKSSFTEIATELTAEIGASVPILGPLVKRGIKWTVVRGYEKWLVKNAAALDRLYNGSTLATPNEILGALPEILAHELALHQSDHGDQRLIILIDEYENAMPGAGSRSYSLALGKGSWDQGLREFLSHCRYGRYVPTDPKKRGYEFSAGFQLVLLGRERIFWDLIDNQWSDLIEGHRYELQGLGDEDAISFLEQAGISDPPIVDAILLASKAPDPAIGRDMVYPLMLELSVDIFFNELRRGRAPSVSDFDTAGRTYAEKRRELLARFIRSYEKGEGFSAILRRLSCAREFDRALVQHIADRLTPSFNIDRFERLTSLSFVLKNTEGDGWLIHRHIADTLLDELPQADRAETHQVLMNWFCQQSQPDSYKEISTQHAEAIGDFYVHAAKSGLHEGQLPALSDKQLFVRNEAAYSRILRQFALDTVAAYRATRPIGDRNIAFGLNFLGTVLIGMGEFASARDAYEEALIIARRDPEPDLRKIASGENGVANALSYLGKNEDALILYRNLLERRIQVFGAGHIEIAHALYNIAIALIRLDRHAEALEKSDEALQIYKQEHGADHLDIASCLAVRGDALSSLDRHVEALEAYERALAIRRNHLSEDHADVLAAQTELGNILSRLNKSSSALTTFEEVLTVQRRVLPRDHPELAHTLTRLGDLLLRLNEPCEAFGPLGEALEIQQRSLTPDHPLVAHSLMNLGVAKIIANKMLDAQEHYSHAHDIWQSLHSKQRTVYPPGHFELEHSERMIAHTGQTLVHLKQQCLGWRARPSTKAPGARAAPSSNAEEDDIAGPPFSGAWARLGERKAKGLLDLLDQGHLVLNETGDIPFSRAYHLALCRSHPLPFWFKKDMKIVEGVGRVEGAPCTFLAIMGEGAVFLPLGNAEHFYSLNSTLTLDLTTETNRLLYLRAFCSWVRGEDGRFAWIESMDDLECFVPDADQRVEIFDLYCDAPEFLDSDECEGWTVEATIAYDGGLIRATYRLRPNGEVAMVSTIEIAPTQGKLRIEKWDGPFRIGWRSALA